MMFTNILQQQQQPYRRRRDEKETADESRAADDIHYLHETLRMHHSADSDEVVELHRTVQSLFEEEEALLNLHMNVIQVSQDSDLLAALCLLTSAL